MHPEAVVEVVRGVPGEGWDDGLLALGGGVLQSAGWSRFQAAIDHPGIHGRGAGWAWSGSVQRGRGMTYLYCGLGPVIGEGASGDGAVLESLSSAGREAGVDAVRVEPDGPGARDWLRQAAAGGAIRPVADVQPRWTTVVDLRPEPAELRRGLSKGHRALVAAASRRGLRFETTGGTAELPAFLALLAATAERRHFDTHGDRYHRRLLEVLGARGGAALHLARLEDTVVAASLTVDFGRRRHYLAAAADPEVNRRVGAATPLVWHLLEEGRARGLQALDLWGVAPPGAAGHRWAGLSSFKRSFGGTDVERLGTWDLPVRRLRYGLVRGVRRLRGA